MKWFRVSSEPVGAQRRTAVENATGQHGWISVRWLDGPRVELFGAVSSHIDGGEVLDTDPQICLSREVFAN